MIDGARDHHPIDDSAFQTVEGKSDYRLFRLRGLICKSDNVT
jgi:hypothetical protein